MVTGLKPKLLILKICTSLSIITSILDIFLYWLFPQNRNFSFSNIIILAIINLIYSVSTLLPFDENMKLPENSLMCGIQSFFVNLSHSAQYLQVSIMSYCIFIKIIKRNHLEKNYIIYRIIFFLLLLSFPLIFSIYLLLMKGYGNSGIFCWIDIYTLYRRSFIKKVILNYYITIWFLLLINLFFIVKIKVTLIKNKIKNEIYEHLIKYPIILLISAFPTTFNVLYRIFNRNQQLEVFIYLQIIFESCFGMVINIIFITSPWIKQSIVGFIVSYKNKEEDFNNIMPIREGTKFSSLSEKEVSGFNKDKNY